MPIITIQNIKVQVPNIDRAAVYLPSLFEFVKFFWPSNKYELQPSVLQSMLETFAYQMDKEAIDYLDRDFKTYAKMDFGKNKKTIIENLKNKRPEIVKHIKKLTKIFIRNSEKILLRINRDMPILEKTFLKNLSNPKLQKIIATGSDLHKHGQQVCILEFKGTEDQTCRIVYKPSPITADAMLFGDVNGLKQIDHSYANQFSFIEIMNQAIEKSYSSGIAEKRKLPTYFILPRSDKERNDLENQYGYIEYLSHEPKSHFNFEEYFQDIIDKLSAQEILNFNAQMIAEKMFQNHLIQISKQKSDFLTDNEADIKQFSYTCGMLMSLMTATGISDSHHENIIVHAHKPFLIDGEVCLWIKDSPTPHNSSALNERNGSMNANSRSETIFSGFSNEIGKVEFKINLPAKNILYFIEENNVHPAQLDKQSAINGFTDGLNLLAQHSNKVLNWFDQKKVKEMFVRFLPQSTFDFAQEMETRKKNSFEQREYEKYCITKLLSPRIGIHVYYSDVSNYNQILHENYSSLATAEDYITNKLPPYPVPLAFIFANNQFDENILSEYEANSIPVYYVQANDTSLLDFNGKQVLVPEGFARIRNYIGSSAMPKLENITSASERYQKLNLQIEETEEPTYNRLDTLPPISTSDIQFIPQSPLEITKNRTKKILTDSKLRRQLIVSTSNDIAKLNPEIEKNLRDEYVAYMRLKDILNYELKPNYKNIYAYTADINLGINKFSYDLSGLHIYHYSLDRSIIISADKYTLRDLVKVLEHVGLITKYENNNKRRISVYVPDISFIHQIRFSMLLNKIYDVVLRSEEINKIIFYLSKNYNEKIKRNDNIDEMSKLTLFAITIIAGISFVTKNNHVNEFYRLSLEHIEIENNEFYQKSKDALIYILDHSQTDKNLYINIGVGFLKVLNELAQIHELGGYFTISKFLLVAELGNNNDLLKIVLESLQKINPNTSLINIKLIFNMLSDIAANDIDVKIALKKVTENSDQEEKNKYADIASTILENSIIIENNNYESTFNSIFSAISSREKFLVNFEFLNHLILKNPIKIIEFMSKASATDAAYLADLCRSTEAYEELAKKYVAKQEEMSCWELLLYVALTDDMTAINLTRFELATQSALNETTNKKIHEYVESTFKFYFHVLQTKNFEEKEKMLSDFTSLLPKNRFVNLSNVDLTVINERLNSINADVSGCNFSHANLKNANFMQANATGVNFGHSNLTWTNFTHANLRNANLAKAELTGAKFNEADLTGVNFTDAYMMKVNLQKQVLKKIKIDGALLIWANLNSSDLEEASLVGANLNIANLSFTNLKNANLQDANLEGTNLEGANLEGANLKGAMLNGAKLRNANFNGANLENIQFIDSHQLQKVKDFLTLATTDGFIGIVNATLKEIQGHTYEKEFKIALAKDIVDKAKILDPENHLKMVETALNIFTSKEQSRIAKNFSNAISQFFSSPKENSAEQILTFAHDEISKVIDRLILSKSKK